MINVGVYGATGYTGYELIKLLSRHPFIRSYFATSESHAGENLTLSFPAAPEVKLVAPDEAPLESVELVFLCLPHATSAPKALAAIDAGARVIDLSADFRLQNSGIYRQWYKTTHPASWLLSEAVYGLTELARDELNEARLVANPGCYPTSILLSLFPLLKADAVGSPVIVDAKSGVSGAGRKPKLSTHFVEVSGNLKPYNIGRSHRHLPEIEQALHWWSDSPPKVIFSPHVIPAQRGLLSTIYAPVKPGWDEAALRECFTEVYAYEPFIQLLSHGETASFAHVNYTNRCAIGMVLVEDVLILTSAIDNLLKGASGQAIQNMNAMFSIDETTGLHFPGNER